MNAGSIGLWLLVTLSTTVVFANPGEHFLNSVISQLKQSQEPQFPSARYRSLYDELSGTISRSAEEFQNSEAQESSENSLHQQNLEFDQSQNQIFHQLNALQHQANFAAGDPLNFANNDQQQQQQPAIIGLQQFNVNGYLNLPPPEAPAEVTEPSQEVAQQNTGPNLFAPNNAHHPSIAVAAFDPQFLIQNIPDLQNIGLPNLQNAGHAEAPNPVQVPVPTYYFYNPDAAAVDHNLVDPFNGGPLNPMEGEQLSVPPSKKIVVEPLFVAMAGFVGIAMIFMSAVLFLPKILSPPPEVSSLKGPQELAALTKLAVETIEGKDCTERIACEVGRAMRSMQVGSKPIKVLEVLLPANLAKQLAQIRRAVANKKTCRLIQCKRGKPFEQKAKIAESNIEADSGPVEVTTKGLDKKQKVKTDSPTTTKPKQSTKAPQQKATDKKQHKDGDKKPSKEQDIKAAPSKNADKKAAQKKDEEKKPKLTKAKNDTEWDFSFFG